MTPRPPDRVRIVGFAGDAPGCGERASSWELVRLLHEIWPTGEPFALDVGPAGGAPPDGRTEIVLLHGDACDVTVGGGQVPVLRVNQPADAGCADTAILTDPLEHGSLAEQLAGRGHFCVVAGAWSGTRAAATLPGLVADVARETGLVPVLVPAPDAARHGNAEPAAVAGLGLVMPADVAYPAAAHLLGTAAFVLGGDPRLALVAALGGAPSILVGGDAAALAGVRGLLGVDWPVRSADTAASVVADARTLQAAPPGARHALRERAAAVREATRTAVRRRLESVVPAVPPGPRDTAPPTADRASHVPRILPQLLPLTLYLRRGVRAVPTFRCLRQLVEGNLPLVLAQLDSRWLVSICDSYADHADPLSARNALLVSTFLAWERLAATHARWADPGRRTMRVDGPPPATNVDLWDGLITVHLRRGDTVNNLLVRYARLLGETPVLLAIWRELLSRIRGHDSVLAALDRPHGHLFDEHLDWLADPRLEGVPRWRRPGGRSPEP